MRRAERLSWTVGIAAISLGLLVLGGGWRGWWGVALTATGTPTAAPSETATAVRTSTPVPAE
jgi:hypothetical protein